jgi:hypothetical protein
MALSWLRSDRTELGKCNAPGLFGHTEELLELALHNLRLTAQFSGFGGTSQISELWAPMLGRTARTYFRTAAWSSWALLTCDFGIGSCRSCVGIETEIPHPSGNLFSSFPSRPRPAGSIQIIPSNLTFLHRPESIQARSQGEIKVKSKGLL